KERNPGSSPSFGIILSSSAQAYAFFHEKCYPAMQALRRYAEIDWRYARKRRADAAASQKEG
ncbi:MAG: hypothetical protein J6L72_07405, partial [Butyricicoccus sp.]|nr:hypothetical protein [Butyricicoccus sp.]